MVANFKKFIFRFALKCIHQNGSTKQKFNTSIRRALTSALKYRVCPPKTSNKWAVAFGSYITYEIIYKTRTLRLYGIGKVRDRLIGEAFLHFSDVQLLQQRQLTGNTNLANLFSFFLPNQQTFSNT